jgi:hypothetical protein
MANPKDVLIVEFGKFVLHARGKLAILAVILGFAVLLAGRLFGLV